MKKVFSDFLSVNTRDFIKSLFMAFGGAASMVLYKFVEMGTFPTGWNQWKQILLTGLSAATLYLIKNFFTNSKDQIGKPE